MIGLGLMRLSAMRGGGGAAPSFDYYVAPDGSDTNDGSSGAPFLTLTKLSQVIGDLSATANVTALVRAGTYTGQQLNCDGNISTGIEVHVTFEEGVTLQGISGVDNSAVDANGNVHLFIVGNGVIIQDYDFGTGNGLGVASGGYLDARDVIINRCSDGISTHGTGYGVFRNIEIRDCNKTSISVVNTSSADFYEVYNDNANGNVVEVGASANFYDCQSDAGVTLAGTCVWDGGRIGTLATPVTINNDSASNPATVVRNAFCHVAQDSNQWLTFEECFGFWSYRLRGPGEITFDRCICGGPAAGRQGLVWYQVNLGAPALTVTDSILTGFATAIGNSFATTGRAELLVDGPLTLGPLADWNNSVAMIEPFVAADDGYTPPPTVITAAPLLGPMDSTLKADWGVASGSPCIGAGSGGGNIGFAA